MVIPAIIPTSIEDLKSKLDLLSFSRAIQIDLVDGKFVPSVSWPYQPVGTVLEVAELLSGREIEVDLMVEDPLTAASDWIHIGAKRIVFHLESLSTDALPAKSEVLFGLAISNDTLIEKIEPFVNQIDFIQMMGISSIGKQGEPFDNRVIERIKEVHSRYPNLPISIDGAVSLENISALKEAGASRFVVGSALINSSDPQTTYNELLKITAN